MKRRLSHLLLPALLVLAGTRAWAEPPVTAPAESEGDTPIPLQLAAPAKTSSSIFRNELVEVEIKDETQTTTSDFDTLYTGTQRTGSSLHIKQQLGEQFTLENTSRIVMQTSGDLSIQHSGDDTSSWAEGASAYNTLDGAWTPASGLHLAVTKTTENDLSEEAGTQGDALLMESQKLEATWQATAKTYVAVNTSLERDYDSGSLAFDSYRATGATISQALGKSNVTWNVAPSWQEDTLGATDPNLASVQAGPQMATSLDWKPVTGTKWSLGTSWNRLDAVSNALAQSTRDVFLAYDRAISKSLQFQLRTEGKDIQTPDAVATGSATPADQREISVQMGQRLSLSNTLSAALDFRHSFQQQNGETWTTAESLATFSLQKSF